MPTAVLIFVVVTLAATGFAWLLVGAIVRFAPRIGLMDRPNDRSLHSRVTPRGGGLGIVVLVALTLVGYLGWLGLISPHDGLGSVWLSSVLYLAAALFIAGISLRDDFKSLGAGLRLACQLGAAGVVALCVASFESVSLPNLYELKLGLGGVVLSFLWIVGLTNVYNFMDGIDGIAGMQGMIAGFAWAIAGYLFAVPMVTYLGLVLAAGCLGFLFYNWSPAKIFMGDVGSAFLGFSFAVLPLLLVKQSDGANFPFEVSVLPLFSALVVWPFLADGIYTFIRRAVRGEAVMQPHRSHLYQRLVQVGWTHARVASLYGFWCVLSAAVALCWLKGATEIAWGGTLLTVGGLPAVVGLVKRREARR